MAVQLEHDPALVQAPEPVLEVIDLVTEIRSARGTVRPVNRVNLRVFPGQAVGLVGESGSGKSMTAFSIMRLFPTRAARVVEGQVRLQGRDLARLPEEELRRVRGRQIGMVFQDPSAYLNPVLTVGAQIAEQLRAHGWPGDVEERVAYLLRQVGLRPEVARRYPHELSGGMRQRVCIASAIACDPPLVLADEPTTALDVTVQAQILQLLAHLQRERRMGLLLITHDFGIVAELCDYVYIMYAAEIVEEGPVEEVFERPRHPYTQGLLEGMLSVTRRDRVRVTIPGSVPDLVQPPSGCRFHPRCARAMPQCRTAPPPRVQVGACRTACWLYQSEQGLDGAATGVGGNHDRTSDGIQAG
ncbi:MAG: ABC transporter ATP-binding protein [Bacillota bacterium]